MSIITRFAPSPTGFLHIGSARTALFNYLFARHHGGKFLLRIEDTDRERSTELATNAIIEGMKWLGLDIDGEPIFQFARKDRHSFIAHQLVDMGKAYFCYLTEDELNANKEQTLKTGVVVRSKWRDAQDDVKNSAKNYVIRLKSPIKGKTIIKDVVQGIVTIDNSTLDDMILLRSDGSPTYMLAVVVDDHDMGITHIIRGDDHLTNAARQKVIYDALNWNIPIFAHIPLIHGSDGAKLSKRHGALGVEYYKDMGYLPETLKNYLLRLGWSHGNDEIISIKQAIEWFNLESIGKSPSRLDFTKLDSLNSYYIKNYDEDELLKIILDKIGKIDEESMKSIKLGIGSIKTRVKNLNELAEKSYIYVHGATISYSKDVSERISSNIELVKEINNIFNKETIWKKDILLNLVKNFSIKKEKNLGEISQILRAILTGSDTSPSVFEIMEIIGKDESIRRIGYNLK